MLQSTTLASVYQQHPALFVGSAVLLVVTLVPAAATASIMWLLACVYLVLVILDMALTTYHLKRVAPLAPAPKRFALITGGSIGIGREMAFQLAAQGFSLVLVARTQSALDKTQREILDLQSSSSTTTKEVEVLTLAADLSTPAGLQSVLDFATDRKLVVDILINNAFVTREVNVVDLTPDQLDAMLTLNVAAMATLSRTFGTAMATRGVGRILNVASTAANLSSPTHALYSSSKAFMLSFSQAMNYELRSSGVSVSCFCPGPVTTNFCDSLKMSCFLLGPIDAKTCAAAGLAGLFRADPVFYDTTVSYLAGTVARLVLPTRLYAYAGAVLLNEPKRALELLKL